MKLEYLFIKKKNRSCSSIESFKNLLSTSDDVSFKRSSLIFKNVSFSFGVVSDFIEETKEISFHVRIETKDNVDVELVEELDTVIKDIGNGGKFNITVLWNDVYIYYAKKLYPDISRIENTARKLICLLMTKTRGNKWKNSNIPEIEQTKIQQIKNENRLLEENIFYNLDFIDIAFFLFRPYQLIKDHGAFNKDLDNLTLKNEEELKDFIKRYEYKSNWERFFTGLAEIDSIQNEWKELYSYRNVVAHNKCMGSKDYKKATKLVKKIDDVLTKIESKIDRIVIDSNDADSFAEASKSLFNISQYLKSLYDSIGVDVWKSTLESISQPMMSVSDIYKSMFATNNDTLNALKEYRNPAIDSLKDLPVAGTPLQWEYLTKKKK